MGDVIHTLPAVQALRCAFPEAMIGWLVEERWAELLCAPGFPLRGMRAAQRPLVDWVHTVKLRAWGKSLASVATLQQIAKLWNDVRSAHYQVAVDLQGAIRSAVLARWSGAPVVYGAAESRESPASVLYTRQAIVRGAHVIEQNFSLAEAVAQMKMPMPAVEFPHDLAAEKLIAQHLSAAGSWPICHSESRRGLGREVLACRALCGCSEGVGRGWRSVDCQLRAWRRTFSE